MKNRHSKEFGEFDGIFFAFNNDQFKEGLEKIGHKESEKVVSIGAGGYIRKDRLDAFKALFARQKKERSERLKNEKALLESLVYELANHEYVITHDPQDAVEAIGYTMETIPQKVLKKAVFRAWKNYETITA